MITLQRRRQLRLQVLLREVDPNKTEGAMGKDPKDSTNINNINKTGTSMARKSLNSSKTTIRLWTREKESLVTSTSGKEREASENPLSKSRMSGLWSKKWARPFWRSSTLFSLTSLSERLNVEKSMPTIKKWTELEVLGVLFWLPSMVLSTTCRPLKTLSFRN